MITLQNGTLTAAINPLGAELKSFTHNGTKLLWEGDDSVWAGSAPWLFPNVGNLNNSGFNIAGTRYEQPRHGFLRRQNFAVLEQSMDAVKCQWQANAETMANYPFQCRVEIAYRLLPEKLSITATVFNDDEKDMPATFGAHPGFNCNLGAFKSWLKFSRKLSHKVATLDPVQGLFPRHTLRPLSNFDGEILKLSPLLLATDALCWFEEDGLGQGVTVAFGDDEGEKFSLFAKGFPQLAVWSPPAKQRSDGITPLCIEPWAGHADYMDTDGDFAKKCKSEGGFILRPKEHKEFVIEIRVP